MKEKPEEHILNVGNTEGVSIKDWVTKCYESIGKIPDFVNVYKEIDQRNPKINFGVHMEAIK